MTLLFWIFVGVFFLALEWTSLHFYSAGLGIAALLTGLFSLVTKDPALQFFFFLFAALLFFSFFRKKCHRAYLKKRKNHWSSSRTSQ